MRALWGTAAQPGRRTRPQERMTAASGCGVRRDRRAVWGVVRGAGCGGSTARVANCFNWLNTISSVATTAVPERANVA